MKIKALKCPICDAWRTNLLHCRYCGTYHVTENGRKFFNVNLQGVQMVRGIPRSFESSHKMDYKD